jgi:sigma-B regulation protein RsbU (phosphoserine phosphatase)
MMMPVASVAAIKVVHPITIARREPGRGTEKRFTPAKNTLPRRARQSAFRPGFFNSRPGFSNSLSLVVRMGNAGSRTAPAMMRWRDQTGSMRAAPAGEGTRARGGRGKDRRPVIGVLFDSVRGTYQTTLLAGLADAASRREVNLAVFAGGVIGAPGTEGLHRNFVFDLCDADSIDGAVILGGALGNALGPSAVDALCARLAPLPMASLALGPPNVPCLTLDEEPGMRQALEHLLMRHGCRRIAFIRGPAVNAEAERRYAIYRAVLTERNLPIDPALICEGSFEKSSGEAAVELLVDERRVQFDGLVACNDYMALGAMGALQERGLQVPSDIAVIGFDDVEEARFSTPPLTTIRQPLYQQGEAALDLVLAQLEGRQVELRGNAPTELVVRQSCGCLSGLVRPGRAGPVTMTETPLDSLLAEHGEDLQREITRAVHGSDTALPAGWDRQLLDAFEAELRGAGAGLFASTLNRLLTTVVASGDDVSAWQRMISALRKLLLPALPSEPLRWVQAEDLWHEARILIADLAERAQAQHRLHTERLAHALTVSGAALLATQQVAALTAAVGAQLPRLGIPGAWMMLTDRASETANATAQMEVVLAHDVERAPGGSEPAPGTKLAAAALLPAVIEPLGRRTSVIVEPLYFHDRTLGCLLMEMGPREGIVYESLAEQVSSALEGARLVGRLVEEATRRQVAERERLEKEMEIATRIQTSILPRDVTVPGLEIAATMRTATEVGGDYYDVIPVEGGCWLGIGDVAGHGLGTGLVMLMMQSGISALSRKLPDATPRELLLALNAMLVDNVRMRLGQREHATLTLLRYRQDGRIAFAGAHEEILILRAATGRCERLPTPGPWVGAKRDIEAGTVESNIELQTGDLLVLYTDGLIEAMGRDGRERFGTDRLAALVEAHGASPPVAVRDALLAALDAFAEKLDDDVTLLVARYLGDAAGF